MSKISWTLQVGACGHKCRPPNIPRRVWFFFALFLFPAKVKITLPPNYIPQFLTLFPLITTSFCHGTACCQLCCRTSASSEWGMEGEMERRKNIRTIFSNPGQKIFFFSKGLKFTTFIFCHSGSHCVDPNWEADKHRAVTCTDSLMIRGQWWIMGWIILHCFLRNKSTFCNFLFTLCKVNSYVCGIPTWVLSCDSYVFAEYEWMYSCFV